MVVGVKGGDGRATQLTPPMVPEVRRQMEQRQRVRGMGREDVGNGAVRLKAVQAQVAVMDVVSAILFVLKSRF